MRGYQQGERLRAGVAFDIPGMGFRNPRTGEIDGFEPDIARAVVRLLLGAPDMIEFVGVTNEERISAVQCGCVDMVLSQLTITADRERQVDFSIPYYVTREGILVRQGSDVRRFKDLKGKRIAVTEGSISVRRMRSAFPSTPLVVTPLNAGTLDAVAKGEADAASNDLINLMLMRKFADHPDRFDIIDIGDRFDAKPYGIAVKKGRLEFVRALNGAIRSLKANGKIDRLLHKSIG